MCDHLSHLEGAPVKRHLPAFAAGLVLGLVLGSYLAPPPSPGVAVGETDLWVFETDSGDYRTYRPYHVTVNGRVHKSVEPLPGTPDRRIWIDGGRVKLITRETPRP